MKERIAAAFEEAGRGGPAPPGGVRLRLHHRRPLREDPPGERPGGGGGSRASRSWRSSTPIGFWRRRRTRSSSPGAEEEMARAAGGDGRLRPGRRPCCGLYGADPGFGKAAGAGDPGAAAAPGDGGRGAPGGRRAGPERAPDREADPPPDREGDRPARSRRRDRGDSRVRPRCPEIAAAFARFQDRIILTGNPERVLQGGADRRPGVAQEVPGGAAGGEGPPLPGPSGGASGLSRSRLRQEEAGGRRPRFLRPGVEGPQPAGRIAAGAPPDRRKVRPHLPGRVPGHEPAPEGDRRPAPRGKRLLRRRGLQAVDLRFPGRRRGDHRRLPEAGGAEGGAHLPPRQFPQPQGDRGVLQPPLLFEPLAKRGGPLRGDGRLGGAREKADSLRGGSSWRKGRTPRRGGRGRRRRWRRGSPPWWREARSASPAGNRRGSAKPLGFGDIAILLRSTTEHEDLRAGARREADPLFRPEGKGILPDPGSAGPAEPDPGPGQPPGRLSPGRGPPFPPVRPDRR